jgi:hypothetical protein
MPVPFVPIIGGLLSLFGMGAAAKAAKKAKKQAKQDAMHPPVTNVPTMTPDQIALANALGQLGLKGVQENYPYQMQDIYDGYTPYEVQGQTAFEEQLTPGLAEQFTAMNPYAQRSSAFPQALGQLGAGYQAQQAAQQMQYGQQRLGQQQNMLGMLTGQGLGHQQFESIYRQKAPSAWQGIMGNALGTGLSMLGNKYGGGY